MCTLPAGSVKFNDCWDMQQLFFIYCVSGNTDARDMHTLTGQLDTDNKRNCSPSIKHAL